MAITAAEYSAIYTINTDQQTALEATHAEGHLAHLAINPEDNPFIAGVLKEIKDLQKEIDYLRTVISNNNDKATFPGFGTTNSTALVGNTPLLQIGTTNKTALAGNTTTITGTQANTITANEKCCTDNASSITGLNSDMKAMQQNLTVSTDSGIEAKFENLKTGTKTTTIDLKITDNNQKPPTSYKATITVQ
jgi:hypothetical protein